MVRLLKDLDASIEGRHVLIVEDIVDTGWTLRLSYLAENMRARKAASVKVCTLLDKPSRRQVDVGIDYCGFVIEDVLCRWIRPGLQRPLQKPAAMWAS